MHCLFPALNADNYAPHPFHASERIWPETNCYVDVWIEVLSTLGTDPAAMLGFTLTQDFEGDQFTFFKVPLEDLESLYNIRVTELAIYSDVEKHIATQIARKRLCLIEVDGFYLPDTKGVGYQTEHGKTTIGINLLDGANQRLEYFHNGGYFALGGADYSGLFQHNALPGASPFLPYSEFAKFPDTLPSDNELRTKARSLLSHHFARRPSTNPIKAFAEVFEAQAEDLAKQPFAAFHKYAFNTLRQFGANFELASSHLTWLSPQGELQSAAQLALTLAETAKSCQFQLARAVTRKRTSNLATSLEPAILAWDALMNDLAERL
jgi:hypothetical protein